MEYEHIFDRLEIAPDPFALCELRGNCDLGLGQNASATLHYILSGTGEVLVQGAPAIPVAAGTLVLVPALHKHRMRSNGATTHPKPDCKPAELELKHLLKSGLDTEENGNQVTALCAHIRVELRGAGSIIDLVRSPIAEPVGDNPALRPTMDALLQELSAPSLGSKAMIRVLLTQCMIELMRRRINRGGFELSWMAALKDPSVWGALQAMLDDPGAAHSVECLADGVGMSRSVFAQRFTEAYGSGPIDLLRDLRIRQAGVLLRDSDLPVKAIAHKVGFASRTAFSRMFEKKTGISPSDFRAAARHI